MWKRTGSANERGVTLVELVAVSAIMLLLASVAVPVAHTVVKRKKEVELRRALRTIREAIDQFQYDVSTVYPQICQAELDAAINQECFPLELSQLVEGMEKPDASGQKVKWLRRLPRDPMTGETEWGTRSSRDSPDSLFSDGINVFDVYTLSEKIGLNEKPYREW